MHIKPILRLNERYGCTADGLVFNLKTMRCLKLRNSPDGYLRFNVHLDGKHTSISVHRCVAETWIGQQDGLEVNHINGIKSDNRLVNLEWVTQSQNKAHAVKVLGKRRGDLHKNSKITTAMVRTIREHCRS